MECSDLLIRQCNRVTLKWTCESDIKSSLLINPHFASVEQTREYMANSAR